jgi:hypothetical protein
MLRIITMALGSIALVSSTVAAGTDIDLNGVWIRDDGVEFDFVHVDRKLIMKRTAGWPIAEEPRGFTQLQGEVRDSKFAGSMMILPNLPNARTACGKQWKKFVTARLDLSADGNLLRGQRDGREYNAHCQPIGAEGSVWLPMSFRRRAPAPAALSAPPARPAELPAKAAPMAPVAAAREWKPVDRGGCDGFDTFRSTVPVPDPARCGASTAGKVVICNADHGGCNYKDATPAQCKDGRLQGRMYVCAGG